MFKDHLVKGFQRQATGWISMFQCSHGHVQAVGLVAQRRFLGRDDFNCLLQDNKRNISTHDAFSLAKLVVVTLQIK